MMPRKYIEVLVMAIASVAAIYAGAHLVTMPMPEVGIVAAAALTVLWAFLAGNYWWAPILVGATITGVFRIGFKVYPLEIALALAVLGLAPLLMVRHERIVQVQRRPLPLIFYLLITYITIRMAVDILPAQGARGNLSRVYFNAAWPFIFIWLFHHYGKSSVARGALVAAFFFLVARAGAAIVGFLSNIPLYIPGINYVLSFSEEDSLVAMRSVAFSLLIISLIFYHSSRSWLGKFLLLPILGFASGLMVMGASRFMTLMFLVLPICFFAWSRRWIFFVIAGVIGGGVVLFVNIFPETLDQMPPAMGRSLSGLIVKSGASEVQRGTQSSDDWHSGLREEGLRRLMQSPATFIFGYGIRPSPDLYETKQFALDPQAVVGIAANVGAYESGLWAVLGVLGVLGFVLYVLFFLHFVRRIMPAFLRPPQGTLEEGILFWGCYSVLMWYATCYFQGGFPGLEVVLIILAADLIDDGLVGGREAKVAPVPRIEEEALTGAPFSEA